MRDLPHVLQQIFDEIPDEFVHKEALSLSFGSIRKSYMYAAPEMRPYWWNQVAIILYAHIGKPDEDWKIRIGEILSGEEDRADWKKEGF